MSSTLIDLVKAVQGLIVMSETLDLMYNALNNQIVLQNFGKLCLSFPQTVCNLVHIFDRKSWVYERMGI